MSIQEASSHSLLDPMALHQAGAAFEVLRIRWNATGTGLARASVALMLVLLTRQGHLI